MIETIKMLRLAAKAVGATHTDWCRNPAWEEGDFAFEVNFGEGLQGWYPLQDSEHALELAVKLGIEIYPRMGLDGKLVTVLCPPEYDLTSICVEHGDDAMAAVRLAIVKAAAKIGETL